jgi:hypothetical protein
MEMHMAQAESEHIHPPPFRNADCKLVQQVTALALQLHFYFEMSGACFGLMGAPPQ